MSLDRLTRGGALLLGLLAAGLAHGGAQAQDGGIGGTGISAYGPIQRFGSIFVNGVEYPLTGARITVDGRPANRSALRLGQVVLVRAVLRGNLQVSSVAVRHAVQGPITRIVGDQITVFGQHVTVPRRLAVRTVQGRRVVPLRVGDVVRVSGLRRGRAHWQAMRITRLYPAGHLPRSYPVLLRATLHRHGHVLRVGRARVVWRVRGSDSARFVGQRVLVTGFMRGRAVEVTYVARDALALGLPGTRVHLAGYLRGRPGAWHADGIAVGIAKAAPFTPGLVDLDGVISTRGIVVVRLVRPDLPESPGPERAPYPAARPPAIHRPEIEQPHLVFPDIERPEISH
ncbi:MAG: DUF5666 domain-containing protein [Acidiferrobacteraceae bacterium]